MANHIYSYFYSPAWDYPPEGPIKVGNVITSILKPEKPLHTAPCPSDDELWSSEKKVVEFSKEKLRAGKFAILTKFLSIFGVGIDMGVNWDKRHVSKDTRNSDPDNIHFKCSLKKYFYC
jgi:hypothetical protein